MSRVPCAVIPESAPKDRSGNRINYMAWGFVEIPGRPNHLSVYASEAYYTGPDSRLRRFEYRKDGFVSVRAGGETGGFLTKPFKFAGSKLALNYSTKTTGSLRVELQDATGKPLPGFTLADCKPHRGDHIDGMISWKSGADLARLAVKTVRLQFELKNADLYSLRFVE